MSGTGQSAGKAGVSGKVETACERLLAKANAAQYGIGAQEFKAILLGIAEQYIPGAGEQDLVKFLESLKTEELALARGCASGHEKAWEVFLGRYRSTLYSAAFSIAKEERSAKELADSLYAELYGLPRESGRRVSKLEYYKGRGSLEGWLRTVVAQEFVNRYRRTKHEVSLEEKVEAGVQFEAPVVAEPAKGSDLDSATAKAMSGLEAEERFLLASYFLDGRTLAEIGRALRVHESTISRKLERVTAGLRKAIRKELMAGGMSSRQADELMQDLDVRDLNVNVRANLQQETGSNAFYKGNE